MGIGLVLIAIGILSITRPPTYQSQVRFRLLSEKTERDITDFAFVCGPFESESNLIKSHDLLVKAMESLDSAIQEKWVGRYAGLSSSIRPLDDVVTEFQNRLAIECDSNGYIAQIIFWSEDPPRSRDNRQCHCHILLQVET